MVTVTIKEAQAKLPELIEQASVWRENLGRDPAYLATWLDGKLANRPRRREFRAAPIPLRNTFPRDTTVPIRFWRFLQKDNVGTQAGMKT